MTPQSDTLEAAVRQLQQQFDWRTSVCDVTPSIENSTLTLQGTLLDERQRPVVLAAMREAAPNLKLDDQLTALTSGERYHWALVTHPVLNVRRNPSHAAELLTQALWGEALEVLRVHGEWSFIRMRDGYLGWVDNRHVAQREQDVALDFRGEATHVVWARHAACFDADGRQAALLPLGVVVRAEAGSDGWMSISTPSGESWTVASSSLLPLGERPQPTEQGMTQVLALLKGCIGVPYLWGGSSPFGYDCSGLAQTAYKLFGMLIPRDADMQAGVGMPVEYDELEPGDLLFFTSHGANDDLRIDNITHVALALGDHRILHANQRAWGTSINSLVPDRPDSVAHLRPLIVCARRYRQED